MKMRVLIDGFNLGLEKGTGVATYSRNLSYSLGALGYEVSVLYGGRPSPKWNPLMREISFFDSNVGALMKWQQKWLNFKEAMKAPSNFLADKVPITGKVVADPFKSRLPYFDHIFNSAHIFSRANRRYHWYSSKLKEVYLEDGKVDLAHWTYPMPLKVKGAVNIYTLHDLVPLRLPYTTLDNKRRYYKLMMGIKKSADHIVTVSEASKRDIVDILGIDASRVTNTYQAVSIPDKYKNRLVEDIQRQIEGTFNFGYKNYFLFFGSIEPKKNIGRIIEAYLAAKVDTPLVIVGAQAWKSEQELKLLNEDHNRSLITIGNETLVKKKVYQIDYVPFPLLVSLIQGAKGVLFPSLYEGFGLPVLEAMLLGTPVLSSNTSSIPEVAGDAAYLVNPYDVPAITTGIRALCYDEGLREDFVAKGLVQAQKYSEENYKVRIKALYESLT